MTHEKPKSGHLHDGLIDVHDSGQLRFWSQKFGIGESQLKLAIAMAGRSVDRVRKFLNK